MLRSDGLTREAFLPLWHEATWHAVDPDERARLLLELGRATVREEGHAGPLLVAFAPDHEPPLSILSVPELPSEVDAPGVRQAVRARLAELGATEAYLLATLQVGPGGGEPRFLLVAWGETLDGDEACWMQAFRPRGDRLEEAPAVSTPEPGRTGISRRCRGLVSHRH